ncbi:MAG: hypothetical protein ACK4GG_00360 [Sphingomonas sp.]
MAKSDQVNTVTKPSEIYVFSHTGEVKGTQRWSDTHVSSSGGGGWVGPHGGRVESAQVHSNVVQRGKFFLREDSGAEHEIHSLFGVRDGQRVIAAWGGDTHSRRGYLMGLHNMATGERLIMDREVRRLNASFGGCALLIAALGAAFAGAVMLGSLLMGMMTGTDPDLTGAEGGLFFASGGAAIGVAPLLYLLLRNWQRAAWITDTTKRLVNAEIDSAIAAERGEIAPSAPSLSDTPPAPTGAFVTALVCAGTGLLLIFLGAGAQNRPRPDNLVPSSRLAQLLPDEIGGSPKSNVREYRRGVVGADYCLADGCYEVMIVDMGLEARKQRYSSYEKKDGCSYEKVRIENDVRAQELYNCGKKLLEYAEISDRRMMIGAMSNDLPLATLKAAVRAVDAEAVVAASKGYRLE